MLLPLSACDNSVSYVLWEDGYGVKEVAKDFKGSLTVNSHYKGKPVVAISDYAFENCVGVTSVTVPDSVTRIGEGAFSGCKELRRVTLPDRLQTVEDKLFYACHRLESVNIPSQLVSIGSNAFFECVDLTSIYLPATLAEIEGDAFTECSGLEEFTLASDNENFVLVDGILYDKPVTKLIHAPRANARQTIRLPSGLTEIKANAFYRNRKMVEISIPEGVERIEDYAFSECRQLKKVTLPQSLQFIGKGSFADLNYLEELALPEGLKEIGDYAFHYSEKWKIDKLPDGLERLGKYALRNTAIEQLFIGTSLREFGNKAFPDDAKLFYLGTEWQWSAIVGAGYDGLHEGRTAYSYMETQPTLPGYYWHYDTNGLPTIW